MIIWLLSLPALVVLLVLFALVDQVMLWLGKAGMLPWRRGNDNRAVSATGFEALHASMSYGKVQELKQRRTSLVMREDAEAGAPPPWSVDLDAGTAVFRVAPGETRGPGGGRDGDNSGGSNTSDGVSSSSENPPAA